MSSPSTPSPPPPRPQHPAVPDDARHDARKEGNARIPDEDIEPADSTADDPRPDDGPVTAARRGACANSTPPVPICQASTSWCWAWAHG
ncbi:hypothetical protein LMG26842_03220 [Achromobacter dolens]|uniref:hypothetical protein n=1 Tax=Achromobacter dolens TaxID=1287738 RepID=UPI00146859B1|nr:hypothetical protein [Achromobacter dolens]CAB3858503.1 hypothetical protein LMG26842_03220 [Achromobacter dolens]